MTAKEFLEQLRGDRERLICKIRERDQLQALLAQAGADGGEARLRLEALNHRIGREAGRYASRRMEALERIDALPGDELRVVYACYLGECRTMEEVAAELGISLRCAYARKERALNRIQRALDARERGA